ncbi:MAG TPA: shikimate dehydrogenase [Anaerovoracaceae bacterium]|nr:shikimate dehydrogenase [Anaerovoracaceae bacterium]
MMKFGLVGEKLSHSQSPQIHEEIMKQRGIKGTYELLEFPKETFERDFAALKNSDYRGVNVTIPYKESVIPMLDNISQQAKYIGAVNTILFEGGKAKGFNTDYDGFLSLLDYNNITVKGKGAVILGSGGSAKAVVKVLLDLGVYDLTIVSRGKQNFHGNYTVSYEFFKDTKTKSDLLVNCTPVGMHPNLDASPIPKEYVNTDIVIDMIYNPPKTLLLKYAEELGIQGINGSYMLKEQAAKAQDIWNSPLPALGQCSKL